MDAKDSRKIDSVPAEFASLAEAAEFWDAHDLADYWDQTQPVEIDVRAPRRAWVVLAEHLAQRATEQARREGVSVETLVNLWVAERLQLAGA